MLMCAHSLKCATTIFAAMNKYSLLEYLVLATSRKAGQWTILRRIGVKQCRTADMNVGESTFHALGWIRPAAVSPSGGAA